MKIIQGPLVKLNISQKRINLDSACGPIMLFVTIKSRSRVAFGNVNDNYVKREKKHLVIVKNSCSWFCLPNQQNKE